jgi:hypothetical protein
MPHKRDGPAPQQTAPSRGEKDERARLLPHLKFSRNYPARTPSPRHRRSRRRQDRSWRGFAVRLYARPGSGGMHALQALIKLATQRFGLKVASVVEIHDDPCHQQY